VPRRDRGANDRRYEVRRDGREDALRVLVHARVGEVGGVVHPAVQRGQRDCGLRRRFGDGGIAGVTGDIPAVQVQHHDGPAALPQSGHDAGTDAARSARDNGRTGRLHGHLF
jgi:hypothetical protein